MPVRRARGYHRWTMAWAAVAAVAVVCAEDRSARAETLEEAMAQAYATNPSFQATRTEVKRLKEQVNIAEGAWLPQASATAGGGYAALLSGEDNSSAGSTAFSQSEGPVAVLSMQVRQPVYNWVNGPRIDQAKRTLAAGKARLVGAEQDVLLRAANAYLAVLQAELSEQINSDRVKLADTTLQATQRQFDAGEVTGSAVAEAEASRASAIADETQSAADLAESRESYVQVIGTWPTNLSLPDLPPGLPGSSEELLALLDQNPSLIAAEQSYRAAQEGVDVTEGLGLPSFFVQGSLDARQGAILGLMSVPLYDGTQAPRVRDAKQGAIQQGQQADAVKQQVRRDALVAWQRYQAAGTSLRASEASLAARQAALERVRREQGNGLRTVADLLSNENDLQRLQLTVLTAKCNQRRAAYDVLHAAGRFTMDDLKLAAPSTPESQPDNG